MFLIKGKEVKMGRVADSTIKGFMYQFNRTLNEILSSVDEVITVEGIVEDIDKVSGEHITAIQCKYHAEVEKFQWSKVYKPILQMIKAYTEQKDSHIIFILYAFFPSEQTGEKKVPKNEILKALKTKNIEYICDYIAYIKKIEDTEIKELISKTRKSRDDKAKIKKYIDTNELEVLCDLDEFINNRFHFIIGQEYDELEKENKQMLLEVGFSSEDIEEIIFPNAIHCIASLSILKDANDRNITKQELLNELRTVKHTAISRWTKELANYKQLLSIRRKQMSKKLNNNGSKRCFVFDPNQIEDFEQGIVLFIKKFVDIYCCKAKLQCPAIFCILGYDKEKIAELVSRLYEKGIEAETGYRGPIFYLDAFLKEPEKKINVNWMQFKIKICFDSSEYVEAINRNKQYDIFQIAEQLPDSFSTRDVDIEVLDINNFSQLEYLLKMKDEAEI